MTGPVEEFLGEYWFLSNFYPHSIVVDGRMYDTNEHYYQAMKTEDPKEFEQIASALTPREAKFHGRNATLRADWEGLKFIVMRTAIEKKFDPNSELAVDLLLTDDRLLIEGNGWMDRFWGVSHGSGQNWLGHLLMARRAELRSLL